MEEKEKKGTSTQSAKKKAEKKKPDEKPKKEKSVSPQEAKPVEEPIKEAAVSTMEEKRAEEPKKEKEVPAMEEKKAEEPKKTNEEAAMEAEMETEMAEEMPNDIAAMKIVKKYTLWSLGAGLIPFAYVDLGAIAWVQLKMLQKISKQYDVKFSENRVKSIVAALAGTITAESLNRGFFTSFIKTIPVVGVLGSVSMPLYAGALTYAVGKVFIMHFESGGTLLDFDPKKVKETFKKMYEEGKGTVYKLKPKKA